MHPSPRWLASLSALVIGWGVVALPVAHSSVAVALDLPALAERAEEIFVGRALEASSRYDRRGRIVTDVSVRLLETLKGDDGPGAVVSMTLLGGVVGDIGMRVPGAGSLPVGDEALIFARGRRDGSLGPVALAQGLCPVREIDGRRMVLPNGAGMALFANRAARQGDRSSPAIPHPRPLEDVLLEVRALVAGRTP